MKREKKIWWCLAKCDQTIKWQNKTVQILLTRLQTGKKINLTIITSKNDTYEEDKTKTLRKSNNVKGLEK